MIIVQTVLAFPIVASLSHAAIAKVDPVIRQAAVTLGATPLQEVLTIIREARYGTSTLGKVHRAERGDPAAGTVGGGWNRINPRRKPLNFCLIQEGRVSFSEADRVVLRNAGVF